MATSDDYVLPPPPVARRIFLQPSTDEIVIHSSQEVGTILSLNKAVFNAARRTSKLWHSDWVLVGRIPLILLDKWAQQGLNYHDPDDWKIIRRMLNSNEWSGLRTAPGQI